MKPKIILFLLLSLFLTVLAENSSLSKIARINKESLANQPKNVGIILTAIPYDFYKSGESFTVSWTETSLNAKLYYSTVAGGGLISNYQLTPIPISGTGSISKTPSDFGLNTGVYYCVMHDPVSAKTSMEFVLIVECSSGVLTNMPSNASTITNPAPLFKWDPNSGVPYYHLLLSDTKFTLSYDANNELVVEGMRPVWQVITNKNFITFGETDPSGEFTGAIPPLIPNTTYNWIVLNNYGNNKLYSSTVTSTPSEFTFAPIDSIPSPLLMLPENSTPGDTTLVTGDVINFQWSQVAQANIYSFNLYELRKEGANVVTLPIINQTTTNTLLQLNVHNLGLTKGQYIWKVLATDPNGISSVSKDFSFKYEGEKGNIYIVALNQQNVALAYAQCDITAVDGSANSIPVLIDEFGTVNKELPVGQYNLKLGKTGYETKDTLFTITNNQTNNYSIKLKYSQASLLGQVKDELNALVNNVKVTATNSSTAEKRVVTAASGTYTISVQPGTWVITAEKEGYTITENKTVTVGVGVSSVSVPVLVLKKNIKNLSGFVKNDQGVVLYNVKVIAEKGSTILTKSTNSSGAFLFTGLEIGDWSIKAEKAGFTAPPPLMKSILVTSEENLTISDIVMIPKANIITGVVTNSIVALPNAVVKAIPSSGNLIYSATTDNQGVYQLSLPGGTYELKTSLTGYTAQADYSKTLTAGETFQVNFVMTPNNSIVKGKVTSAGSDLAGVNITTGNISTTTDNQGNYSLSLAPGSYNINALKASYTATSGAQTISLSPGVTINNINFEMVPNASTVGGKVLLSGSTVTGAQIFIRKTSSTNQNTGAVTDDNGNYSISLLPGQYKLWAVKTTLLIKDTVSIVLAAGNNLSGKDLQMIKNEAYISGVTKKSTGETIGNINLEIVDANNPSLSYNTTSGVYGNFSVTVTPGRQYNIKAVKSGYLSEQISSGVLTIGTTLNCTPILVAQSSSFNGLVKSNSNEMLYNALVRVINLTNNQIVTEIYTATNGKYSVALSSGNYKISASKIGYLASEQNLEILPGVALNNIDFTLNSNFSILQGKVSNLAGIALAGITVKANSTDGGGVTQTDANGNYKFEQLIPGSYIVSCEKQYYQTNSATVVVPGSTTITKNFTLQQFLGQLSITTGKSGATVFVENKKTVNTTSGITDDNGNLNLSVSLSGTTGGDSLKITVSKTNWFTPVQNINIANSETKSLTFTLMPINGSLSGLVKDENGNNLGSVTINAISADGFSGNGQSGSSGNYNLTVNPGRNYVVSLLKNGYSTKNDTTIIFPANQDAIVQNLIMVANNKILNGKIIDQKTEIVSGIKVKLSGNSLNKETTTDQNGNFSFNELAPYKTYNIATIAQTSGIQNNGMDILLSAAPTTNMGNLVIQVFKAEIKGRVTDNNNLQNGIAGVTVSALKKPNGPTFSATTQPDGSYNIPNLYDGTYQITLSKNNWLTVNAQTFDNLVLAHKEIKIVDPKMEFVESKSVSGNITIDGTAPNMNIPITLISTKGTQTGQTELNGNYTFASVLPYNSLTINTILPIADYENTSQNAQLVTTNLTGINLAVVSHKAKLTGTVLDSTNQTPIADCEIILKNLTTNAQYTIYTATSGSYEFSSATLPINRNLYPGQYSLKITRPGYYSINKTISLVNDINNQQNIVLGKINGSIAGKVTSGNVNLNNAMIYLVNSSQVLIDSVLTNNNGEFQFVSKPIDTYSLKVRKLGYKTDYAYSNVVIDVVNYDIIIPPIPASVLGTVNRNSNFFSQAKVFLRDLQGTVSQTLTNEYGDYVFSGLQGYYYLWSVSGDSLSSVMDHAEIIADSSKIKILSLINSAKILGNIKYNGVNKPGVLVQLRNTEIGNVFTSVSDNSGNYQMTGLIEGAYELSAAATGFKIYTYPDSIELPVYRNIQPGQTLEDNLFVQYGANSIVGAVMNATSGQPIANAFVKLTNLSKFKTRSLKAKKISRDFLLADEDSVYTTNDGSFGFKGKMDGNYQIKVSHPAYQVAQPQTVNVTGGVSTPSVVVFNLNPYAKTIYGTVKNNSGENLNNASVIVKNATSTFIDTVFTSSQGAYAIQLPEYGDYAVRAECINYYNSDIYTVSLTIGNSNIQKLFILQQKPAVRYGKVVIKVAGIRQALTNGSAKLLNSDGSIFAEKNFAQTPDSVYSFSPRIGQTYSLDISTTYLEQSFNRIIDSIKVQSPDTVQIPETAFNYIPGAASINGKVYMKLPGSLDSIAFTGQNYAKLYLKNSQKAILDSATTNSTGSYIFSSVVPNQSYTITVKGTYNTEKFVKDYFVGIPDQPNFVLTLNPSFKFILSSVRFTLLQSATKPVANAVVKITSDELTNPIYLTTDSYGKCHTDSTLYSGLYLVNYSKEQGTIGQFIPAQKDTVLISSISYPSVEKYLPLQFDTRQLIEPRNSYESFSLDIYKTSNFTGSVELNYTNPNNISNTVIMTVLNDSTLRANIPAQNKSGVFSFYFKTKSSLGSFNNINTPYQLNLITRDVISESNSSLMPTFGIANSPVYSFGQGMIFEVNLKDEGGNSLDAKCDTDPNFLVKFTLSNSLSGTLSAVTGQKRQIKFKATDNQLLTGQSKILATITQQLTTLKSNKRIDKSRDSVKFTLQKEFSLANLNLQTLNLGELVEIPGDSVFVFNFSATSDSNATMSLPFKFRKITSINSDSIGVSAVGKFNDQSGKIVFKPKNGFTGAFYLKVSVKDPNPLHNKELMDSVRVVVKKKINFATIASDLMNGQGCNLNLKNNMFTDSTQQAYIWMEPYLLAEIQKVGTAKLQNGATVESEVKGTTYGLEAVKIYATDLDGQPISVLAANPAVNFEIDPKRSMGNNKYIGYWDNSELNWKVENAPSNTLNLPKFNFVYSFLTDSRPLGMYNLKLLPNPFSPYDEIGSNKGLQISFSLSSAKSASVKVTVKVFTLNGTLVRTIFKDSMLKGDYFIGNAGTLYWDGLTDDGKMARNGRYVVQMIVQDAADRQETIKSVVLIK